jgi:hypothetical protein
MPLPDEFPTSDADGFSNLDLSSSPSFYRRNVSDEFQASDKDGLSNVDCSGLPKFNASRSTAVKDVAPTPTTNRLAAFVGNPDVDSLARVAKETGNADLIAEVTDQREEAEAVAFIQANPDYPREDASYELMRAWIDDHRLEWTSQNLTKAFRSLCRSGQLQAVGSARNLTASQKLLVIASAKTGKIDEAISQYLDYSLPNAEDNYIDANDFLSDVRTLPTRNEAVAFVWYQSRPVQDSDEWRKFQKRYFRLRPVVTINDLDQCWDAFLKDDKVLQRERLMFAQPEATPPTTQELNALDDEGVDKLYHQTLRHYAKTTMKAGGILV